LPCSRHAHAPSTTARTGPVVAVCPAKRAARPATPPCELWCRRCG
jgi:hypothetical protein